MNLKHGIRHILQPRVPEGNARADFREKANHAAVKAMHTSKSTAELTLLERLPDNCDISDVLAAVSDVLVWLAMCSVGARELPGQGLVQTPLFCWYNFNWNLSRLDVFVKPGYMSGFALMPVVIVRRASPWHSSPSTAVWHHCSKPHGISHDPTPF